jgi:carbon monoxide dehydrogenase subunit G
MKAPVRSGERARVTAIQIAVGPSYTSCIVHNPPAAERGAMIISETFVLHAPRDRVAAFLLDIESVRTCVPGVGEVIELSPSEYEAVMTVQVGPIRSAFAGSIEIDDSGAPGDLAATAQGIDRGSGSSARVSFAARLIESSPELTTVESTADVAIRGRLGTFGTGVIQATAKQILNDFVACVDTRLRSQDEGVHHTVPSRLSIIRAVWLGLWSRVRTRIRPAAKRGSAPSRDRS